MVPCLLTINRISESAPPVNAMRPWRLMSRKILSPLEQHPDQMLGLAIENVVPCVYPKLPALELFMTAYSPPFRAAELFTPRQFSSLNLTCSKRGCLKRNVIELTVCTIHVLLSWPNVTFGNAGKALFPVLPNAGWNRIIGIASMRMSRIVLRCLEARLKSSLAVVYSCKISRRLVVGTRSRVIA